MFFTQREKRALMDVIDGFQRIAETQAIQIEKLTRELQAVRTAGNLNSATLEVQQHQIDALRDHVKPLVPA